MGSCSSYCKNNNQDMQTFNISIEDFEIRDTLGQGGYGQVFSVTYPLSGNNYAMKKMSKPDIINKKSINSVMNERKILAQIDSRYIINMRCSFQDNQYIYLLMDQLQGQDLRKHLDYHKKFSEEQTKFFLACIIQGLDYLRTKEIVHRDIKPENIVFDSQGYLRITDMGIARDVKDITYFDTSGTPGYMAPEVICNQNHSYEVDYFALGVMGYECMLGIKPYNGENRKVIKQKILESQVQIMKKNLPSDWSIEAADFINRCLQRKPKQRLGYKDSAELKNHVWFQDFDWERLNRKLLISPYQPMQYREKVLEYEAEQKKKFKNQNICILLEQFDKISELKNKFKNDREQLYKTVSIELDLIVLEFRNIFKVEELFEYIQDSKLMDQEQLQQYIQQKKEKEKQQEQLKQKVIDNKFLQQSFAGYTYLDRYRFEDESFEDVVPIKKLSDSRQITSQQKQEKKKQQLQKVQDEILTQHTNNDFGQSKIQQLQEQALRQKKYSIENQE